MSPEENTMNFNLQKLIPENFFQFITNGPVYLSSTKKGITFSEILQTVYKRNKEGQESKENTFDD